MTDTLARLRAIADPGEEFRAFSERILVTNREIIGVRMPALRKLAKEIAAGPDAEAYLWDGLGPAEPAYEEVMLYGLVLAARSRKMPLERVFTLLERLIPYFDSWAHVDVVISDIKVFARHRDEVYSRFAPLKAHPGEFHKRTFAILVMDFFLDAEHVAFALRELADIPQGQYYVDMAIAWAVAEALVKHYDVAEPWLSGRPRFSRFVHNKAIQKARESLRVTPEQKEHLKSLKI
jgi:3-methyladenine DNA glycosylase AlkD